ncbi:MAG: glycosyltransferase family 4 protein [Sedimentisphaerales bacterium]|nr:glycosyltransferase family 4 protein [Sedimentisphaerales bacterium]
MNVLMLNYEFPPIGGGAANANLHLLKEYAGKDNLRVDVLTSAAKPGFFAEEFSDNITIYKVGLHKKSLHLWRRIEVIEWLIKARGHYRRLVRENNYDLTHAFFGFPTGYLCDRGAGAMPYIISLRGSDVPGSNVRLQLDYKILGPVFKRIWKNAAVLVACSEGLRARALEFLPSVSIDVIPNGVDLDKFSPAQGGVKAESIRLLTVGRLSATKRVEMLIEAAEILHNDGLDVRLTIAGGGAMEGRLQQMIEQKGLGEIVEMAGRVEAEQMPALYRQSDILVSATMQEGMSNAMLEAMACGLPIVTTRCEGVGELIGDNGTVVEQGGARAIADAVRSLAENRKRYEQMTKAARTRADRFSWKSVAEEYLSCYNAVMNSHIGRRA